MGSWSIVSGGAGGGGTGGTGPTGPAGPAGAAGPAYLSSFRPGYLFAAYPTRVSSVGVRHEHGYQFYCASPNRNAVGAEVYWDTASRSMVASLWVMNDTANTGTLVTSVSFTSVIGVNLPTFASPVALTPYKSYVISVHDQVGGNYILTTSTAASLDAAPSIIGAYYDAFAGTSGSIEKVAASGGDVFYTKPRFASGGAGTFPDQPLIGAGSGIVGVGIVLG